MLERRYKALMEGGEAKGSYDWWLGDAALLVGKYRVHDLVVVIVVLVNLKFLERIMLARLREGAGRGGVAGD